MARYHYWSFIVNEEGLPIEGADISVCLAGTEEPVYVYEDEYAGEPINSVPQIISLKNGYFEFWLPDTNEEIGYDNLQKFKLSWDKQGIESGTVDYIDIFPPVIPVNELDTNKTKNKAVSNYLAFNWESHILNDSHIVHGIEEADPDLTEDTSKNKLVNNVWVDNWNSHVNSTATTTIGLSGGPHGFGPLDFSEPPSNIYLYDRIISYYQGNKWNTHVDKNYSGSPHDIEQVDETSYDATKNKLVSNDLIRSFYNNRASIEKFIYNITDWTLRSDGDYDIILSHEKYENFPQVTIWDITEKEIIYPSDIISENEYNVRIINEEALYVKVLISG